MSIPLLLERRSSGRGPKVPLRVPFNQVVVEGLAPEDMVKVFANGEKVLEAGANGHFDIRLERDAIAQAEIIGCSSCVSVRLEKV
jgi:hypothetical protein